MQIIIWYHPASVKWYFSVLCQGYQASGSRDTMTDAWAASRAFVDKINAQPLV